MGLSLPASSYRRPWLLTLLVGFLLVITGVLVTPAADAAVPARTAPVWLPVHTAFGLDCAGNNPGCSATRSFFSIDVIPSGQFGKGSSLSHARVYAMGGGTVHVDEAHGTKCGRGSSFGTSIWIDHGNGVKSRYGHLSKILVKNGARVAAGAPIGVVGTTGKSSNCSVSYVDFEVVRGKLKNSNAHRFGTLRACTTSGTRQSWPVQAATTKAYGISKRVHFATWDKVPHGTQFPASSGRCIPAG